MGHSRADKGKTHQRIVTLASKRFREKGLMGIGIADLMKEAGLTVGGFTSILIRAMSWWRKRWGLPCKPGSTKPMRLPRADCPSRTSGS
jgi:hypothetical protein